MKFGSLFKDVGAGFKDSLDAMGKSFEKTFSTKIDTSGLTNAVDTLKKLSDSAQTAADILRDAGYEVVSTGNADNFEYEDVTIQVKASAEVALELLEEDLSKSYTIGETSTDLSEDESFDALVIIGV